ncbi:MAG TPA: hypothetical protein VMH84_04580 [Xanthobacteraceae bacterium]|nr:hypothetical protein [Xanthobacteraceae bacterium]
MEVTKPLMAGARIVRLRVSASDDVEDERLRVNSIAVRLNGEFPDRVRFEILPREDKAADQPLQPQILEASDCDIVIGIFGAQSGSELPPALPRLTDGALPDIHVLQKRVPGSSADEGDLALLDHQGRLFKSFLERWLRSRDGQFAAAFHTFTTMADFDAQIEKLLRDWIASHLPVEAAKPERDVVRVSSEQRASPRSRGGTFAAVAAVVFALIAAFTLYSWRQAQSHLDAATSAIATLVDAASAIVRPSAEPDTTDAAIEQVRDAITKFSVASGNARALQQRARTALTLAEIDLDRGKIDRTREEAQEAFKTLDPLAKSGNLEARHLRAQAERLIGATYWEKGDNEEAKVHYERGIADLNDLLKIGNDPAVAWRWMRSLAKLYQAQGDILLYRLNQSEQALEAFEKARLLRARVIDLGHQGPAFEHDLAWIMNKRGDVEARLGNDEAALKWFVEARDRLDGLKDRIWDNPRWAEDLGTIYSNIGALKRKQNRFAEAAPQFAQAEDILTAVYKRDSKNLEHASALNWARFVRAENLFRWALAKNDRILMLEVREQAITIIAMASDLIKQAPQRTQEQLNKVREEAFRAAVDASLRQWNGNHESAAAGFIEAADIIKKDYLPVAAKSPWPDLLIENIQYLEWAGMAYVKAQKLPEAQAMFKRALDMLAEYRGVLGDKLTEDYRQRIAARIDHAQPAGEHKPAAAVDRVQSPPAPAERAPAPAPTPTPTESAPRAGEPAPDARETVTPPQQ